MSFNLFFKSFIVGYLLGGTIAIILSDAGKEWPELLEMAVGALCCVASCIFTYWITTKERRQIG
jgi:hypothetical protein